MNKKILDNISLLELMPSSISNDKAVQALATAVDLELKKCFKIIPKLSIWEDLNNNTNIPVLESLKWERHLEAHEGWELTNNFKQKQKLIKNSINIHRKKGTRYSLEQIFKILDIAGKVIEWWEEPAEDFLPYTFDFEAILNRQVSNDISQEILNLIYKLKNTRSHLRKLRIGLMNTTYVYLAAKKQDRVVATIYPPKQKCFYLAGCLIIKIYSTIYPGKES